MRKREPRPNRDIQEAGEGKKTRPRRERISHKRDLLKIEGVPKDKIAKWINDIDNRIQEKRDDGWEFVYRSDVLVPGQDAGTGTDIGSALSRRVSYDNHKNEPVIAYAMCIWKDWYEDDKKVIQDQIKEIEDQMKQAGKQAEGTYGKVTIS